MHVSVSNSWLNYTQVYQNKVIEGVNGRGVYRMVRHVVPLDNAGRT